ncbi:rRNA pseudouridine synthase [Fructobacillus sp. M158]|uniref:pseudouridine synthase n=1 Tax=Fructobacillus parabroussonetiae TaxID=2713174 RepID=UPI00200AA13B|nr:pseudouridine synthase [Fructobacillus parabroussonetiae]MCK8617096.1 rRNA pseudouridine synthase [Fructobacillus parabroussonetiae]
MAAGKEERLQKVIAQAGIASRRAAEKLILEGRVAVNGQQVSKLGTKVTSADEVKVDGVPLDGSEKKVYYLLNKPRGVVTTASDDKGRQTVVDLLTDVDARVYPVGRLDYDTTGALIMTNDGELANQLMHPKGKVDKVYTAKVKGIANLADLAPLKRGIMLNGKKTAPARVAIEKVDQDRKVSFITLTIHEGRNHQVKDMLQKVGYPVDKLRRDRYAFLDLLGLQAGDYRDLSHDEVKRLKNGDYRYLRRK